jgi:hypothetical protein
METQTHPTRRWIIITPTLCEGDIPAYWTTNEEGLRVPLTHGSLRDAYKEIADTQIMKLQEFIDNEDLDEDEVPEFEPEDYILPCEVYPNGVITTEPHGTFYDGIPKD